MKPPLELVESKRGRLKISDEQARALMALGVRLAATSPTEPDAEDEQDGNERTVISCSPASDGWYVTVRNLIGLIGIGDLQIRVNPKVPTDHLIYLLQHSNAVARDDSGAATIKEDDSFVELLAKWFNTSLAAVLAADPLKDYRSLTEDLATLRGRVHPLPTARNYYAGRHRIRCEFDEFDVDTPVNRVLKAAAEKIASEPGLPADTRDASRRHVRHLEDVGRLEASDLQARPDVRMRHYRDALDLARLILRSAGLFPTSGTHPARTLLFYTPTPVEDAIRTILQEDLEPKHAVRRKRIAAPGLPGGLNLDLHFDDGEVVGDVKYKLIDGGIARTDLYQAVTFATAAESSRSLILGFSESERNAVAGQVGNVAIRTVHWLVSLEPEAARERLVSQIEELIEA